MNSLCLWFPFILLHSGAPKEIFLGGARENRFFFSQNWHFEYFQPAFKLTEKWESLFGRKKYPVYSTFSQYSNLKSQWYLGAPRCLFLAWALQCSSILLLRKDELYDVSDPSWLKLSEKSSQTLFSCKKNGILLCQKVNRAIMFWPQQIFKQGQKKSRSMMAFSCAIDCYGNPIAKSFGIWKPGQLLFLKP